jgi:hypothetical protein
MVMSSITPLTHSCLDLLVTQPMTFKGERLGCHGGVGVIAKGVGFEHLFQVSQCGDDPGQNPGAVFDCQLHHDRHGFTSSQKTIASKLREVSGPGYLFLPLRKGISQWQVP